MALENPIFFKVK